MKPFNRDRRSGKSGGRSTDDRAPRFNRENSSRFEGQSSDRFERRDFAGSSDKRMFSATCAKCSDRCEVPFKPRENKPVLCSNCFRNNDRPSSRSFASSSSSPGLDQINQKLDKIMEALDIK